MDMRNFLSAPVTWLMKATIGVEVMCLGDFFANQDGWEFFPTLISNTRCSLRKRVGWFCRTSKLMYHQSFSDWLNKWLANVSPVKDSWHFRQFSQGSWIRKDSSTVYADILHRNLYFSQFWLLQPSQIGQTAFYSFNGLLVEFPTFPFIYHSFTVVTHSLPRPLKKDSSFGRKGRYVQAFKSWCGWTLSCYSYLKPSFSNEPQSLFFH